MSSLNALYFGFAALSPFSTQVLLPTPTLSKVPPKLSWVSLTKSSALISISTFPLKFSKLWSVTIYSIVWSFVLDSTNSIDLIKEFSFSGFVSFEISSTTSLLSIK